MAAYYDGSSEVQSVNSASAPSDHHGIQTLHLMNPSFLSSYSDHNQLQFPSSMLFSNTSSSTLNLVTIHHGPPINHYPLGITLQAPAADVASTDNNSYRANTSEFVPAYNIWGPFDQSSVDASGIQLDVSGFRRPGDASPTRQGLSLTLSSQQVQQPRGGSYDNNRPISHKNDHLHIQEMMSSGGDDRRVSANSPSPVSAASNGGAGIESTVLGSKYLQAAQELLDEVVNVGKAIKSDTKEKIKITKDSNKREGSSSGGNDDGGESCSNQGIPLTTAQRQELQMKKAKLVNMLDEVERRYRHYHSHMQTIVSSFEQAAGFGGAKSYTSLALRRITKQFRCLKDTISGQIKATSKSLGEEECLGAKVEGSRLRFLDQQLRQQRALQQFGMLQHNNAWRPQRGLPESAVSVLRAWLFEHFLHPYPKDSDKHILAKQTGLTRSQVSNWFINARVRLWKPMVEEMYLDEIEQGKNGGTEGIPSKDVKKNSRSINAGDNSTNLQSSKSQKPITAQQNASPTKFSNSAISVSKMAVRGGEESSIQSQKPGFSLIRPSELERISQSGPKKSRSSNNSHDMQNSPSSILSMDMEMKQRETNKEMINMINFGDDGRLISNNIGGFGGYNPIGDVGRLSSEQLAPRFPANNNVSLTLGLQHCENLTLSGSQQQNFFSNHNIQLGRRLAIQPSEPDFFGVNTTQNSHPMTDFENIGTENRKRLVAQLLPDFVT